MAILLNIITKTLWEGRACISEEEDDCHCCKVETRKYWSHAGVYHDVGTIIVGRPLCIYKCYVKQQRRPTLLICFLSRRLNE